jgi:peptidoglycan hydrolase-like protein with peptidoglycan-binding domain
MFRKNRSGPDDCSASAMKTRTFWLIALFTPLSALAGTLTSLHPEKSIPDPVGTVAPGPYSDLISRVQEKLIELGFDAGPVNGDLGEKTQAALAQFQLSRTIPAGGQLDDLTLAELGVEREAL